ncbi:hypothetical protein [Sphingobacterium hungaricum]|uniref:Uncharacterized protein n=1 Tax=Sphingobacterium hungaricum TaxID=2082723 RepID=A0A928UX41_9SPHI|nr:hypothetical protein [Sphingobacterium hungaricum]MBE8712367.1 hypothetical protein [Sphingobacterium hungaricum]
MLSTYATQIQMCAARLDPTGINKFTFGADGSKTLEVNYFMVQSGADRASFTEKWTFVKAR